MTVWKVLLLVLAVLWLPFQRPACLSHHRQKLHQPGQSAGTVLIRLLFVLLLFGRLKIREMVDANTVVGQPITTQDGVTLIPVSKLSFGFATGGSDFGKEQNR